MSTRSAWTMVAVVVGLLGTAPGPVAGQDGSTEAVMVAAGRWAQERLPSGSVRLDPHRTGDGAGEGVARAVARALGAELGTLEETRSCRDLMDPSTCSLDAEALLAIATPEVEGDEARVRVYAWYRQSEPREPVGKRTWDLQLRRSGGGWSVVAGGG